MKQGKYQTFMDAKLDGDLIETLQTKESLKDKYRKLAHAYYRFFNDGDESQLETLRGLSGQTLADTLEYEINLVIEEILVNIAMERG